MPESAQVIQGGEVHEKVFNLIVNGQPKKWEMETISFDQVVNLAFNGSPPTGPNVMFTVAYSRGPKENPEGTLSEGQSVYVKSGMVFDVTPTNKS
jgi:Multiubiquitin